MSVNNTYNSCQEATKEFCDKTNNSNVSQKIENVNCPSGKLVACSLRGYSNEIHACLKNDANDVQPQSIACFNGRSMGGTMQFIPSTVPKTQ